MGSINKQTNTDIFNKAMAKTSVNPRAIIARRARQLLMGQGYRLQGKNIEIIDELFNKLNMNGFLNDLEYNLSYHGRQAIGIDLDGNNEIRLLTFDHPNSLFITDNSGKVLSATTFRKSIIGNMTYDIMEMWDKYGRRVLVNNNKNALQAMGISGYDLEYKRKEDVTKKYNAEVPEKLQTNNWAYDFGDDFAVPIIILDNLSNYNGGGKPDSYPVQHLETTINAILTVMEKELIMNRTRYLINTKDNDLMSKINMFGVEESVNFQDNILQKSYQGGRGADDKLEKSIEVISGDNRIESYIEGYKKIMDIYIDGSGYSTENNATGQQTVISTLFTNKKDLETTKAKKNIREQQLNSFIKMFIIVNNLPECKNLPLEDDIKIKLRPNIVYDETTKMDYIEQGLTMGLLPLEQAVQIFHNTTDEYEVNLIMDDLKKEQEEREEKMKEMEVNNPEEEENNEDTGQL